MVEKVTTFTPLEEKKVETEPRKDIALDASADVRLPIPTLLPPTTVFEAEPDSITGSTDTGPVARNRQGHRHRQCDCSRARPHASLPA